MLHECWLLRRFRPPWGDSIEYWCKVGTVNSDGYRGQAHFVNKGEGAGETLRLAGTDIRGMDKTDSHTERYASTLSSKRPQMTNVGKDVEKVEP